MLTLHHTVYLPGNDVLFPAGTTLTPKVLWMARERIARRSHRRVAFAEYLPVHKDLDQLFQLPPYAIIFQDTSYRKAFQSFLASVQYPEPLLQILEYFRVKDFYTYRHSLAVMALTVHCASVLFPGRERLLTKLGFCPSHDLGKFCVPALVLQKSRPLSSEEKEVMEHHCAAGYALLKVFLGQTGNYAAMIARDHHERNDGNGYPRGIALRDELIELISVCDIYDALLSPRPYRPASFDNRTALEELTGLAQRKRIRWKFVAALIALNRRDKPSPDACRISLERRGTAPEENNYGVIDA